MNSKFGENDHHSLYIYELKWYELGDMGSEVIILNIK